VRREVNMLTKIERREKRQKLRGQSVCRIIEMNVFLEVKRRSTRSCNSQQLRQQDDEISDWSRHQWIAFNDLSKSMKMDIRLAVREIGGYKCLWEDEGNVKLGKGSPSRLSSVGFQSWSRFLAVSMQVTWVINPTLGCHYFTPGLQLPPQPLRGLLPILLLGEQRHNGCKQFA